MNKDLENLVDIALADGYISEKEKGVLRKKAEKAGFDLDELDMILEGRLYNLDKEYKPKVRKCVSCGEVLKGVSQICPSCDYIQNVDLDDESSLHEYLGDLQRDMYELKTFDDGDEKPTSIAKIVFKIIFTAGLYIPYKLLIKKGPLFDKYAKMHTHLIRSTDAHASSIFMRYGHDSEVSASVKSILAERDAIIKKRRLNDWISAGISFLIIVAIIWAIMLIPTPAKKEKVISPEEKIERLINEKKIDSAKIVLPLIEDAEKKEHNRRLIRDLEIDSLAAAGNYDAALEIINLMDNDPLYDNENRDRRIYYLLKTEIESLIAQKEYKKAKARAELVSILDRDELLDKIKLAEKINKKKK